ncbi:hypothetical protein NESM_000354000 [Novymonas esmeraldas]|uniref:Uncharacterized protein n=1 Tax=Novymonas esmeraldas TaxID=1808958 RepID=A0AAW0EJX7_9TRYP
MHLRQCVAAAAGLRGRCVTRWPASLTACAVKGVRQSCIFDGAPRQAMARTLHTTACRRAEASADAAESSSAPSAVPWQKVVHLVTTSTLAREHSRTPTAEESARAASAAAVAVDDAPLRVHLDALRQVWSAAYHPVLSADAHNSASAAATVVGAPLLQERGLLPTEAEKLPLLVQVLGQLGAALLTSIAETDASLSRVAEDADKRSTSGDDDGVDGGGEDTHMRVWLAEVQALLLFIGQHQLRYVVPRTFARSLPNLASAVEATAAPTRAQHAAEAQDTVASPPPAVRGGPGGAQLRGLSRLAGEQVSDVAPPLPSDELLRVVVLVEAARVILDVAQPPPLASGVRAEVYKVLLSVLGASEQLPSSTLASLATCLARCVDSYAAHQQLSPPAPAPHVAETAHGSGGTATAGCDPAAVRSFVRPVTHRVGGSAASADTATLSPVERHEAAQLERLRGGLSPVLRPTSVLHHQRVLASVVQRRLAEALHRDRLAASPSRGSRGLAEAGEVPAAPRYGSGAAPLAREERMEAGLLGLLTLEQRKTRAAATAPDATPSAPVRRQRRTVSVIAGATSAASADDADSSVTNARAHPPADDAPEVAGGVGHISLTDVAELCTAMASIGFRGDGPTAAEEPVWAHTVAFICSEIAATAAARDAAAADGGGGEAAATAAPQIVMDQMLEDVRDVCFALDRVGHLDGYDSVMAALVQCGFLHEPIVAPSAGRRVLPHIRSSSSV